MGKGDKKSKRGKIHRGTFGVRRPKIKKRIKRKTILEMLSSKNNAFQSCNPDGKRERSKRTCGSGVGLLSEESAL